MAIREPPTVGTPLVIDMGLIIYIQATQIKKILAGLVT